MTKFKAGVTAPQAAFLEWALEQPGERPIYHTEGWCACAVGDYYRETNGTFISKHNGYVHPAGFTNWSEYAQHILPKRLRLALNYNGRWAGRDLNTYGGLQEVIRRHYVENDDESPSD